VVINAAPDGREKPLLPTIEISSDLLSCSLQCDSLPKKFGNTPDEGNEPLDVRSQLQHVPFH
jgi:hypothetical protein